MKIKILKEINYTVLKIIKQKIKEANKNPNEEYEKCKYFLKVYSDYFEYNLSSWIIQKLEETKVIGNSKKTVILPDRRITVE